MTEASPQTQQPQFEALTTVYERLRHSTDAAELSEFARRPLPDKSDQAGYSRATALLEAVAGNPHTPLEDRIALAQTMPFPNILVKLAQDESVEVRKAVAANEQDKNWLVGRLTKDESAEVREVALRNARTSWKMRLEGGAGSADQSRDPGVSGGIRREQGAGRPRGAHVDDSPRGGAEPQYTGRGGLGIGAGCVRGGAQGGLAPAVTRLKTLAFSACPPRGAVYGVLHWDYD